MEIHSEIMNKIIESKKISSDSVIKEKTTFIFSADEKNILSMTQDSKEPMLMWACDFINKEKINIGEKDKIKPLLTKFISIGIDRNLVEKLNEFIKNEEIKNKENKRALMISNPEKRSFVRDVLENHNTALHLFTRNSIFMIVSDIDRKKYTEIINEEEIDIPINRRFQCWQEDLYCIITGPILCDYDQKVFLACIKLWHNNDCTGISLTTNLSEIWRTIGNKSAPGQNNINALKRALHRLTSVNLLIKSNENKNFWSGGIIDSVIYKEKSNKKNYAVILKFNEYMLQNYLEGAYATIHHKLYNTLTPYEQKLYLFLRSHNCNKRVMHFAKFVEPLGIKDNIELKKVKFKIKSAINELLKKEILSEGLIDKDGQVHTTINSTHMLNNYS